MSRQENVLENSSRPELIKLGRKLEYVTIAYNSLEGLIAVAAGLVAGNIALVGVWFWHHIYWFQFQTSKKGVWFLATHLLF